MKDYPEWIVPSQAVHYLKVSHQRISQLMLNERLYTEEFLGVRMLYFPDVKKYRQGQIKRQHDNEEKKRERQRIKAIQS